MNLTEAAQVLRKVLAHCPAQKIDELTPDAWAEALEDIPAADALEAVARIGRRSSEPGKYRFIEPGHIRWEVNELHGERLRAHQLAHGPLTPPADLEGAAAIRWLAEMTDAITSGNLRQIGPSDD